MDLRCANAQAVTSMMILMSPIIRKGEALAIHASSSRLKGAAALPALRRVSDHHRVEHHLQQGICKRRKRMPERSLWRLRPGILL